MSRTETTYLIGQTGGLADHLVNPATPDKTICGSPVTATFGEFKPGKSSHQWHLCKWCRKVSA